MMKRLSALFCIVLLGTWGTAYGQDWFSDDFEDGVIDPAHWVSGGDITESGGVLNLDREGPDDFCETISTYGCDYTITVVIKLNYIVWNDMFHGLDITDDAGAWGGGISFGFSQYGWLYLGNHGSDGNSISYSYGDVNNAGQWRTWTFQRIGTGMIVSVDGVPIDWGPSNMYIPDGATIRLPGLYEDGDGGQHVGVTSSDVDFFSIMPDGASGTERTSWSKVKSMYR